ncbi:MAG: phage holin family protein [Acidobacteria bacterium]|nr:phage holin family protein [Acidobacteriota bacterium]
MRSQRELESARPEVGARESFADLLVELASQSSLLVREEVLLARRELREDFEQMRASLLKVAVGIGAGVMAVFSLLAAGILALSQYWEPWQAALTIGLGIAVVAAIMIFVGLAQLKQARIKPEQTLETLEENKAWLQEIT